MLRVLGKNTQFHTIEWFVLKSTKKQIKFFYLVYMLISTPFCRDKRQLLKPGKNIEIYVFRFR